LTKFEVWDDPNALVRGNDPQLEKAVEEVMKLIENRTAAGLKKK